MQLPGGLIALSRDIYTDWQKGPHAQAKHAPSDIADVDGIEDGPDRKRADDPPTPNEDPSYPPDKSFAALSTEKPLTLPRLWRQVSHRFPIATGTLSRLPIPLLPFALCMFILVRALSYLGWIALLARGFSHVCTTPARTVFFIGYLTALVLCPLCGTNIGGASCRIAC